MSYTVSSPDDRVHLARYRGRTDNPPSTRYAIHAMHSHPDISGYVENLTESDLRALRDLIDQMLEAP
jgi:hypothetical protein